MEKIKISAVSYLNTIPFLYGISSDAELLQMIELTRDYPAECARKVIEDEVDLGLIPVAVLPLIKNYEIVSEYCIASNGNVQSVLLLSDVPLSDIKSVFLDYQSRTSVNLLKILAVEFWQRKFNYLESYPGYENQIQGTTAGLVIGDRALNIRHKFNYSYDLAEEWLKFSGLPFVFALWVSNKHLPQQFVRRFNIALQKGVSSIALALEFFTETLQNVRYNAFNYLTQNIDFQLDSKKKKAVDLYLELLIKHYFLKDKFNNE